MQHEMLLEQRDRAVQATNGWASRGESFSTGLAGIRFALQATYGNYFSPGTQAPSLQNIFSARTKDSLNAAPILYNSDDETTLPETYGDVFVGRCSQVWTELTLGKDPQVSSRIPGEGAVNRPGLGHGELIRELIEWLTQDKTERDAFVSTEQDFHSGGWCNGESGLLSAVCIARHFDPMTSYDEYIAHACAKLLEWARVSSDEECGLCHGVSGALVVVAGAGRLLQDDTIISHANDVFEELTSQQFNARIHTDFIVDASWLTGTAGLLWSSAAIKERPGINPLLPIDSRLFN
jgi:hypothetical protein